jgi:hypothetical protein
LKVRVGSFSIDHNLAHYAAINRGALFLACKAKAVEFDASFYAVQALFIPSLCWLSSAEQNWRSSRRLSFWLSGSAFGRFGKKSFVDYKLTKSQCISI